MACCCQSPSCDFDTITISGKTALPRAITYSTLFSTRTEYFFAQPNGTYRAGSSEQPYIETVHTGTDLENWQSGAQFNFRCSNGVWTLEFYREDNTSQWQWSTRNQKFLAGQSKYGDYDTSSYSGSVIIPTDATNLPTPGTYNLASASNYATLCSRTAPIQFWFPGNWAVINPAACQNGIALAVPDTSITIT